MIIEALGLSIADQGYFHNSYVFSSAHICVINCLKVMKKILIADDHAIVRIGVSELIRNNFLNLDCYEAASGDELFSLMQENTYELIVLDLHMPGVNSLRIVDSILNLNPANRIIILSLYADGLIGEYCIRAGAMAYVSKMNEFYMLKDAIEEVLAGRLFITPAIRNKIQTNYLAGIKPSTFSALSQREIEVMHLVFQGSTNKQIASLLSIASTSVSTYKRRVLERLGVENFSQLLDLYRLVYG